MMDDRGYPVTKVPVPVTADTLAAATGGSIAAGGVLLSVSQWVAPESRRTDEKGALSATRRGDARPGKTNGENTGAVVSTPSHPPFAASFCMMIWVAFWLAALRRNPRR